MSYLDKPGLKAIGTRWVYTNKGDAANPFIRAPRRREQHVCDCAPAENPLGHAHLVHDQKRRALAEENVLGFYDISGAHFHSPARRTIVIKVPREDDECPSGYAVLDKAMYGTKDAAQCFDVASENAMTAMGCDTSTFFALSVPFERS